MGRTLGRGARRKLFRTRSWFGNFPRHFHFTDAILAATNRFGFVDVINNRNIRGNTINPCFRGRRIPFKCYSIVHWSTLVQPTTG